MNGPQPEPRPASLRESARYMVTIFLKVKAQCQHIRVCMGVWPIQTSPGTTSVEDSFPRPYMPHPCLMVAPVRHMQCLRQSR